MYSRNQNSQKEDIIKNIPKNYGGSMYSPADEKSEQPHDNSRDNSNGARERDDIYKNAPQSSSFSGQIA